MPAVADPVVVITGGAGDIGRALGTLFGREGYRVALFDLPGERQDSAQAALCDRGFEVMSVACDVTDGEACESAIEQVLARFGAVDVLVNNAGLSQRSRFDATAPEVIRRVMEVNFFGAVNCTRAALPAIVARQGTVVAISSVAGFAPLVGRTAYAASKHALHGFFGSLRTELQNDNVGVLVVCPSFVDTGLAGRALSGSGSELRDGPRATTGRALTPEDVAASVLEGVTRRQRLRLVSPVAHVSFWLSRLAPRLYDRLMLRGQREEFG